MPQIMLLLHMQIRRYFNKICDNIQFVIFEITFQEKNRKYSDFLFGF